MKLMRKRDPEGRMPLAQHLSELRRRILFALVGILLCSIAGWFLYTPLVGFMVEPLQILQADGRQADLNFSTVGMAFELQLKMALFLGVLLASPWWILQLWLFIAPALRRKEKFIALGFTFSAALMFIAGAALGWFIIPRAIVILTNFAPDFAVSLFDGRAYFRFFMQVVGAFGISFLLPVIMVGLNFIGLIRGRTFLAGWRWAVIGCSIFAAIVNPLPDAWSMLAIMTPMVALYFVATGLALFRDRRIDKKRKKELESMLGEGESADWIQR